MTKHKQLVKFIVGSVITLFLIILLWTLLYLKIEIAIVIQETIIGVLVTYAMFLYEFMINGVFSFKSVATFTHIDKDLAVGVKLLRAIVDVGLRVVPIVVVLFVLAVDFASTGGSINILEEVLGGVTGSWALLLFFDLLGLNIKISSAKDR